MSRHNEKSRRSFIKKALGTAIISGAAPSLLAAPKNTFTLQPEPLSTKRYGPNDQVNIAVIGMGIMGFSNLETAVQIPGVKLLAACDLYNGRLERTKELYGKDIFTTRNY